MGTAPLAGLLVAFLAAARILAGERDSILQTLHVPRPLPSLALQKHGEFAPAPGLVAERVSYRTQLAMRVPAIVYRSSRPAGRRPAIIVVNGHGGDKYSWYAFYSGVAYARLGAVVLTYDPIGEGERNSERKSGTRAHDKPVEPEEMGRWMGGLMQTDLAQAVSYLQGRPDVDPTRIAAVGYSMGSFVLGIACAVEPRLKACILAGGGNLDGEGGYWDRSKPMCQGIPYRSLRFLGDRGAALYAMSAARGPTLVMNGTADSVVNVPKAGRGFFDELRVRVATKNDSANVFETMFFEGVSHRPHFVTKPAALWLHRHLRFPGLARQAIEAMPETHVSEWAREGGVEMDKLYATEEREGGTMAIGTGVPALSREQLSVFPAPEWQWRRGEFVYEEWVKRASAASATASPRSLPAN